MIRRPTLILLVVFLLVLGGAWYLQREGAGEQAEEAIPTSAVQFLLALDREDIRTLRIASAIGQSVEYQKDSAGTWLLESSDQAPLDQSTVLSLMDQAVSLRVLSTLTETLSLGQYGLTPPAYSVEVVLADNSLHSIEIGNLTPTGSGYYTVLDGGDLQIVNKANMDRILELLSNPPIAASPTLEPASGSSDDG